MKRLLLLALLAISTAAAQTLEEDATATILVGPLIDSVDATAETGLTISQADVRLSKNGGNMAQKNEATSCTHDELGMYACPLDATDTNTAGRLTVTIGEAGTMVWSKTYQVIASGFYEMLDGTETVMTARDAGLVLSTTVDTATSQTILILSGGASNDDAYPPGSTVQIVGGTEECEQTVQDYDGSTTTVTLAAACSFTVAVADDVRVFIGGSGPAMFAANDDLTNITGASGAILDTNAITANSIDPGAVTEIQEGLATAVALAAAQSDLDTLTDEDGSSWTAIPWNSSWDTEVQSEAADALAALTIAEPTGPPAWDDPLAAWVAWMGAWSQNEINQTATTKTLRNAADDGDIATCAVSDDATTFTKAACE